MPFMVIACPVAGSCHLHSHSWTRPMAVLHAMQFFHDCCKQSDLMMMIVIICCNETLRFGCSQEQEQTPLLFQRRHLHRHSFQRTSPKTDMLMCCHLVGLLLFSLSSLQAPNILSELHACAFLDPHLNEILIAAVVDGHLLVIHPHVIVPSIAN